MEALLFNVAQPLSVQNIFLLCLYAGFVYAVVTFLLGDVIGHGHELTIGHDVALPEHGQVQVSPLHPLVLAVFVTSFGASGTILYIWLFPTWVCVIGAVVLAVTLATLFFYAVIKTLVMAQCNSVWNMDQCEGLEAKVTVPIPVRGMGEVTFLARQKRCIASAHSFDGRALKQGDLVLIVKHVGSVVYVQKIG